MRQLICRRTCEWLEIGYTYRAVRISYQVHLAEVAHIHTGYCKITTCYRARPDKRAQRVAFSSYIYIYIYQRNAPANSCNRLASLATRYTHQRRCLAQIATKGSCMPNFCGIPGKSWRPIASTSNNYYYLAHAQKRDRHIYIYIYIYIPISRA